MRTYDPGSGEGLQKLVREALGETVRPVTPGQGEAPPAQEGAPSIGVSDLPTGEGETITFTW